MFRGALKITAALLVITMFLVGSLFIPTMVNSRAELANVPLGYPFRFVVQDNSRLSIGEPDSPPFPYPVRFMSFYHSQTRVQLAPLLINYLVLYGLLSWLLRSFRRRSLGKGT